VTFVDILAVRADFCTKFYVTVKQLNVFIFLSLGLSHFIIMFCRNTLCPPKRPPFYFSNNCQKVTDFNDFFVKSWENLTSIACTFAHLTGILYSHFTLGNPKKSFGRFWDTVCIWKWRNCAVLANTNTAPISLCFELYAELHVCKRTVPDSLRRVSLQTLQIWTRWTNVWGTMLEKYSSAEA